MALKLPIENAQGYSPEYHRIAAVRFVNGKAHVEIASHKDVEARQAGKGTTGVKLVIVTAPDEASRKELYELIKATPHFNGAEDV